MEIDEIKRLKKENGDLKAEVARLGYALKIETDSTTKHIKILYQHIKSLDNYIGKIDKRQTKDQWFLCQHIADLHDIVSPIEDKIFPAAKSARKQLKSIIGRKKLADGKDLDKRTS